MKLNVIFVDLFHNPRLSLFMEDKRVPISNIGFLFGPILDYKRGKLHKINKGK